jgi:hypothetical protein
MARTMTAIEPSGSASAASASISTPTLGAASCERSM